MIGRLAARGNNDTRPFNPIYVKTEEEDKAEVMIKGVIRIATE